MSLPVRATGAAASLEPTFAQGLANETRRGGRGRGVRGPREAGAEANAGIPRVGAAREAGPGQAGLLGRGSVMQMPRACVREPQHVVGFARHPDGPVEETLAAGF